VRGKSFFAMKFVRSSWHEFVKGFTRPSLASLAIIFSVNTLAFLILCFFLTPDLLSGQAGRYLPMDPFDEYAFLTYKVLDARYSETPDIVILGNSVTVRCVAEEKRLAKMFVEHTGLTAPIIYDLSVDGQTVWEMAAIGEQLPPQFHGVLVFGVDVGLLAKDIDALADHIGNPRIGFSSEALEDEARFVGLKVPGKIGNYFIDNWSFFLLRAGQISRNVFVSGPQRDGDPLDIPWMKEPLDDEAVWDEAIELDLPKIRKVYDSQGRANLAVIGRIIKKLKARTSASFILAESPINPRWYRDPNGKKFFEQFHNDLRLFATEHEMEFISVNEGTKFFEGEFFDPVGHLRTREARERCSKVIAAKVVEVVTKNNILVDPLTIPSNHPEKLLTRK
jgi:hypothetical protein